MHIALLDNIQALPEEFFQEAFEFISALRRKTEALGIERPAEPKGESPYEALRKSGLIGCIKDGPHDLSTNYKEYIIEYLEEKHGYR